MAQAEDLLVRATWLDGRARVFACVTTDLVNELQRRHATWPVATAALGRTASISAMIAMTLKEAERLTVVVKGDGPLGKITVDANSEGIVRGYVENPHVHLPANAVGKLDVGRAVGGGLLYVTRDMGLRDFYQGSAELQTGEIADDFTYYFAVSEQIPSTVAAGVLVDTDNSVNASGGFIIQLMPGHIDADIARIEDVLRETRSVTELLSGGLDAFGLLDHVASGARVLETHSVRFACSCSKERLASVLKSLGSAEIQAMVDEDDGAEVICHFCGEHYLFSRGELEGLLESLQCDAKESHGSEQNG